MQVKLKIFQSPKSRGFLDPNIDQIHHQIANVCSKAMEITTKIGKRLTENTSCFHLVTQTYNFNAQIIKTLSKSKLISSTISMHLLVFHHQKKKREAAKHFHLRPCKAHHAKPNVIGV